MEQADAVETEEIKSPAGQAEKQRRMVIYSLNATLLAGLALTLVYLGGRVMETRAAAKTPAQAAPAPVIRPVSRAEAKPPVSPTVITPVAQQQIQPPPLKRYSGAMIEPKPGERYLQIGAYGPTFTRGFVEELKDQGFNPVVAAGPTEDVYRVLIGPLDAASIESVQAQLAQAGITGTMARKY